MSTTCVKGISPSSFKGWRRRAQQYAAAQQYYQDLMAADGYRDAIYDRSQIQSALKQQRKDVAEFKRAQENPKPKPDLPKLDIIGQGDLVHQDLSNFQGATIEHASVGVVVEKLGFETVPYQQPHKGVDIFCKKDGKYYAIEAKSLSVPDATKELESSRIHGDIQCSDTWLGRQLEIMKTGHVSKNKFNQFNAELARDIEAQGGVEAVKTLLIHINPHTMNIFVHERMDPEAKNWEPIAMLEFDPNAVEKP